MFKLADSNYFRLDHRRQRQVRCDDLLQVFRRTDEALQRSLEDKKYREAVRASEKERRRSKKFGDNKSCEDEIYVAPTCLMDLRYQMTQKKKKHRN